MQAYDHSDRIEAGTFMIAGAAMGKEVIIDNVIPTHLESLTAKLRKWVLHRDE